MSKNLQNLLCLLKFTYHISLTQCRGKTGGTAQKIKFSIEDSSINVTKSAVSCGFVHIY